MVRTAVSLVAIGLLGCTIVLFSLRLPEDSRDPLALLSESDVDRGTAAGKGAPASFRSTAGDDDCSGTPSCAGGFDDGLSKSPIRAVQYESEDTVIQFSDSDTGGTTKRSSSTRDALGEGLRLYRLRRRLREGLEDHRTPDDSANEVPESKTDERSTGSEEWWETEQELSSNADAKVEVDEPGGQMVRRNLTPHLLREQLALTTSLDDWYVPPREVTDEMLARRERIRSVLDFYYRKPLNTRDDSPWSMMHHMLAWSVDGYIEIGGPGGRPASVVGWLAANGPSKNKQLLTIVNGQLTPKSSGGLQGHDGQLLAMFAQARVSADQTLRVAQREFTIHDLMDFEKLTCRSRTELTFKLMGLIHYLPTDYAWTNSLGETWDFPRLMAEEIQAPINGVTCGGTHRLMALSYSVRRRRRDGYAIDGIWEQARQHVENYQQLAFRLQNRDGSLSSDFFRKPGTWGDIDRKLRTTGHVLEWLVFSLPHEQLQDIRVRHAVDYLSNLMISNRYYRWGKGYMGKGHLGHAIRALSLYEERVFGTSPGNRGYEMAPKTTTMERRPPNRGEPGQRQ